MNPVTLLYLMGSFVVFLAERMFEGSDMMRWSADALGVLLVLAAFGARMGSFGRHPQATKLASAFMALSASAGLLYVLQLRDVLDALGVQQGDSEDHLRTALQCAIPLVWLVGLLPAAGLNRTLAASPHSVHPLRMRSAWDGGLAVALGVAMLFPLNWLAHENNQKFDYSYFKTTAVGEATKKAVDALNEPVRAVLFFPPGSEVLEEVKPYFDDLEGANLSVEVMDHAMEPEQAKEWKVRENGNIALVMGEKVEIIKLGDKLDSARKDLRKLDSKVQTALLKLSREKRTAYFTVGHDEFYWKNAESDQSNIESLKKVLEAQNFKVKELGIDDGLAQKVPEDAAIVFVVGPKKPFFPEEIAALKAFRDQGGALFLMLEPGEEDMSGLADVAGVTFDGATKVMSDKSFLPLERGTIDHQNVGTNKFTSHESVTTLTKHANEAVLITPGAGSIDEAKDHPGKVTMTVKGMPDWFHDLNGNFEFDKDTEKRGALQIAAVASGPAAGGEKSEWRIAVTSDATLASNYFIRNAANAYYLVDTVAWLTQDPALGGETESEEDAKLTHSKEDESKWFWATTAVLPLLVLAFGAARVNSRKKGAA